MQTISGPEFRTGQWTRAPFGAPRRASRARAPFGAPGLVYEPGRRLSGTPLGTAPAQPRPGHRAARPGPHRAKTVLRQATDVVNPLRMSAVRGKLRVGQLKGDAIMTLTSRCRALRAWGTPAAGRPERDEEGEG
jgi:hypothetical protein